MTGVVGQDSDVYFGEVDDELPDWRDVATEEDPDDEELEETPVDVIEMLGFDPKEFSDEDEDGEKTFCPTGPGGGVDPTCSPGETGGAHGIPTAFSKANDEELFAISAYQGASPDFNAALRKNSKSPDGNFHLTMKPIEGTERVPVRMDFSEVRGHLDSLINKSTLDKDVEVYRGMPSLAKYAKLQPGDTVSDKAFLSTTLSKDEAVDFATNYHEKREGVIVKLSLPKGHNGVYVDSKGERPVDVRGSKFLVGTTDLGSSEVLLPRALKLKVASIEMARINKKQVKIIHMTPDSVKGAAVEIEESDWDVFLRRNAVTNA